MEDKTTTPQLKERRLATTATTTTATIAVVGGGPAGLRAAEVASAQGARVDLYEGKRSTGRKFLVAGKSGLNLTNAEAFPAFLDHYQGAPDWWKKIIEQFDNDALRAWAGELGIETFAASSGKVFPTNMKAAPLLRRLLERLRKDGVNIYPQHHWSGLSQDPVTQKITLHFQDQPSSEPYDAVIFALGGGSWPQTGSDGSWVACFLELGIKVTPLTAANCGWESDWSPSLLEKAEGLPLKNIVVSAGEKSHHGELVITRYGLEGGPIYRLGPAIKTLLAPLIHLDFKPTFTADQLTAKMESAKRNILSEAAQRWKLSPAQAALMESQLIHQPELAGKELGASDIPALAEFIKAVPIPLTGTRPLGEAISTAGGVAWAELDESLMLKKFPNIYCAGEMLDWEAPTGGYLLQAAFATGTQAGKAVSIATVQESNL